ncbi:MAG: lysylphosphatidylglycerol synthase transmembrane domain-containing protein [Oscillospiraceae bacterium]
MKSKKNSVSLLVMLALMGLTGFLFLKDQSLSALADTIRNVNPLYLVLGFALMLVFVGSEAAASKMALSAMGHRVRYRRCFSYSGTGFYFSSITPSATGGQPAQVYYMAKDGIPAAHGTLNMLLITVCYQVVTLVYAVAAWFLGGEAVARLGTGLGVLLGFGGTTMLLLTTMMLLFMFRPAIATRLAGWVLGLGVKVHLIKNEKKAQDTLNHQMEEYRKGAQLLKTRPLLFPAMLGMTFVQMTALYLVPYVVYRAFGLSGGSAVAIVATQALVTLAVSCLPLPGSVGASEVGFVQAFTLFFGAGLVTPAMLLSRGITFYGFLLVAAGITIYVHLRTAKTRGPVAVPNQSGADYRDKAEQVA